MTDTLRLVLKNKINTSRTGQKTLSSMLAENSEKLLPSSDGKILDLGCGEGDGHSVLEKVFPGHRYYGIDIEDSPEASKRKRSDLHFESFNGVHIPYVDDFFDLIFCRQVLEHVRHPDLLIEECARVLKPAHFFAASVSQLEPYHSRSVFNWTAYGIVSVFEDHNFKVVDVAPGIDGVSLILRRLFGPDHFNGFFSHESLFNHFIEVSKRSSSDFERSLQKIMVAGHLVFLAQKCNR